MVKYSWGNIFLVLCYHIWGKATPYIRVSNVHSKLKLRSNNRPGKKQQPAKNVHSHTCGSTWKLFTFVINAADDAVVFVVVVLFIYFETEKGCKWLGMTDTHPKNIRTTKMANVRMELNEVKLRRPHWQKNGIGKIVLRLEYLKYFKRHQWHTVKFHEMLRKCHRLDFVLLLFIKFLHNEVRCWCVCCCFVMNTMYNGI